MANNVYSKIKICEANLDAEHAFIEVFQYIEEQRETGLEFSHILPDDEIIDYEYMDQNIGPRYANITSFMGTEVEITSGWISPSIFFEILGEHLSSYDLDIKMTMEYVDEFYNFAGYYTYFSDGISDHKEESGGWFRKFHENIGGEPRDLPDFIYETLEGLVDEA